METIYVSKITADITDQALIKALIPVPGSPGLYQEAYAPKGSFNLGYLRLSLNLTQSGTDAPVVEVNLNEVGAVITPEYIDVGVYRLNWNINVTNLDKTELYGGLLADLGSVRARVQAARVGLATYDDTNTTANDILTSPTAFEVRFYPGWDA